MLKGRSRKPRITMTMAPAISTMPKIAAATCQTKDWLAAARDGLKSRASATTPSDSPAPLRKGTSSTP